MRKLLYYLISSTFLSLCLSLGALFFALNRVGVDFSVLSHYDPGRPSLVLDDADTEWTRFALDRREPVSYNTIPEHVIHAFISAEDWKFFDHSGISFKGIVRSLLINMYYGRKMQGASTITQQLVKLLFFDTKKTFSRKIKEQMLALLVEQQFTKEQILGTYLNHVFFGCGIYGVEAAAQRFWGVHVHELTIAQAAVVAGIVRSPGRYCPLLYPLSSQRRRDIVLGQMMQLGYITQEQYHNALQEPVNIIENSAGELAPYLKEKLRITLKKIVGKKALYSGGLLIKTTLNKNMQYQAQQVFNEHMLSLKSSFGQELDGSLLTIEVQTGHIKALIGGTDFTTSKFNRAFQARRQMGSIFKPLIYADALERGFTFSHTEIDEPMTLVSGGTQWSPNNYNDKFLGQMTLAYALSHSNNIIVIKLFLQLGAERAIKLAQACDVQGPFYPYPSLALGCVDATLKEAVGMFNMIVNDGVYVEPYCIEWVKDRWDKKIYKQASAKRKVLETTITGQIIKVLGLSPARLRKHMKQYAWPAADVIGKTGTTNDSRTCWFMGSTPTYTTGVYIGFDDNRSLGKNIFSIRTAFPLWLEYNAAISHERAQFKYDSQLHEVLIDERTGEPSLNPRHPEVVSIMTGN